VERSSAAAERQMSAPQASGWEEERAAAETRMLAPEASNQDGRSASELARSAREAGGGPTPLAFLAVTQLLEACVSSLDMPKLQDIVKVPPPSPACIILIQVLTQHCMYRAHQNHTHLSGLFWISLESLPSSAMQAISHQGTFTENVYCNLNNESYRRNWSHLQNSENAMIFG